MAYTVTIKYEAPEMSIEDQRVASQIPGMYDTDSTYVNSAVYEEGYPNSVSGGEEEIGSKYGKSNYSTNVEGPGHIDVPEFYSTPSVPVPSAIAQFKLASMADKGTLTFETKDYKEAWYYAQLGEQMAEQGFTVTVGIALAPNEAMPEDGEALKEAFTDQSKTEIIIPQDMDNPGLDRPEGASLELDLNGKQLTVTEPFVGTGKTNTNAVRFLKGSDVTIKNGTISSETAKIIIQNYSNLTLDNVKVIGNDVCATVLSNNFGNTVLKNGTEIVAASADKTAFDCYYGLLAQYDDGVTVTIEDDSVKITGKVNYAHAPRVKDEQAFAEKAHLYVPNGYESKITAPDGFKWEAAFGKEGYMELRKDGE